MKTTPVIPYSYATWRHCINVECGIPLTAEFVQKRLDILSNPKEYETQRFVECYGVTHLQNVLSWFGEAARQNASAHDSAT